jgi:hypothetical protein
MYIILYNIFLKKYVALATFSKKNLKRLLWQHLHPVGLDFSTNPIFDFFDADELSSIPAKFTLDFTTLIR